MPWHLEETDGKVCVHEGEKEGKLVKCHATRKEAQDHMAALYANMPAGEKAQEITLVEVIEDYGIVEREDGTTWKVAYTLDEQGEAQLIPEFEWMQVERKWVAVGKTATPDLTAQFQAKLPVRIPAGNALKTIGKTTTELRVANYMCLFGGRDLEGLASPRVNADGSRGEYFTKATKFTSPYTEVGVLYEDWEHGQAPQDEPGADEPLGIVDWKTAKITDKGLFVERVLNRRNRYVQMLEELIDQGLIGTSSQAIPSGVQKAADGHILAWPLERDTLTVAPMEPRNLTDNQLQAIKRAGERLPALKSIFEAWQTEPKADARGEPGQASGDAATDAKRLSMSLGDRLAIELDLLQLGQE